MLYIAITSIAIVMSTLLCNGLGSFTLTNMYDGICMMGWGWVGVEWNDSP